MVHNRLFALIDAVERHSSGELIIRPFGSNEIPTTLEHVISQGMVLH